MKDIIINSAMLFTALVGLFSWIAMICAALPGIKLYDSFSIRVVRLFFYSYPFFIALPIYFIYSDAYSNIMSLLWGGVTLIPLAFVWLIFNIKKVFEQGGC